MTSPIEDEIKFSVAHTDGGGTCLGVRLRFKDQAAQDEYWERWRLTVQSALADGRARRIPILALAVAQGSPALDPGGP